MHRGRPSRAGDTAVTATTSPPTDPVKARGFGDADRCAPSGILAYARLWADKGNKIADAWLDGYEEALAAYRCLAASTSFKDYIMLRDFASTVRAARTPPPPPAAAGTTTPGDDEP